jgi:hypothetical protein
MQFSFKLVMVIVGVDFHNSFAGSGGGGIIIPELCNFLLQVILASL